MAERAPLAPEADGPPATVSAVSSPEASPPEAPETSPLRILVAEDNLVNQRVVALTLKRLGYRADIVADGTEVLSSLRQRTYDVILMDVRMPLMDGIEATRQVRADDTLPQPRILAMTADATHEKREACFASGMDGFISKPFDPPRLAKMLAQIAEREPVAEREPSGALKAPEPSEQAATAPEAASGAVAFPDLMDRALDATFYGSLLSDLVTSLAQEASGARAALQAEDLTTAGRAAHSAKSLGLLLGDGDLSDRALALQQACDDGNMEEATASLLPFLAATDYVTNRARTDLDARPAPEAVAV